MSKPRRRVCLEDGLMLNLNKLIGGGFAPSEGSPRSAIIRWTGSSGQGAFSGLVTITKESEERAALRVEVRNVHQELDLIAQPRRFGGVQWYFKCPVTEQRCLVVWMPPGATRFCSRQAWGKQVAYSSQFESPFSRAVGAREKVKSRLIGDLNRRDWQLPPKPKWMRWNTYERLAQKYSHYEGILDQIMGDFLAKDARG
jgi:hypothetical protein